MGGIEGESALEKRIGMPAQDIVQAKPQVLDSSRLEPDRQMPMSHRIGSVRFGSLRRLCSNHDLTSFLRLWETSATSIQIKKGGEILSGKLFVR
jgi:hypothetical protein